MYLHTIKQAENTSNAADHFHPIWGNPFACIPWKYTTHTTQYSKEMKTGASSSLSLPPLVSALPSHFSLPLLLLPPVSHFRDPAALADLLLDWTWICPASSLVFVQVILICSTVPHQGSTHLPLKISTIPHSYSPTITHIRSCSTPGIFTVLCISLDL